MTEIITLCGSTKFKKDFERMNTLLTLDGYIVLAPGCFGHVETNEEILKNISKHKDELDALHFKKIQMSDFIIVIDVDGYIGESTRHEINYAKHLGREVYYLSEMDDLWDPVYFRYML